VLGEPVADLPLLDVLDRLKRFADLTTDGRQAALTRACAVH
jgi:hypothetical protein